MNALAAPLAVLGLCVLVEASCAAHARADEPKPLQPPRYLAALTAGVPLRVTRNLDFDQGTFGPAYSDALVGYVLGASGRLRHGFGAGLSVNLSEDGGFTAPVSVGEQWVLMPSYLGYFDLSPDVMLMWHVGLPIEVHGGSSAGLEAGWGAGYRVRAGLALFAEASADAFRGAEATVHATLSLEAGVLLDYEVLP